MLRFLVWGLVFALMASPAYGQVRKKQRVSRANYGWLNAQQRPQVVDENGNPLPEYQRWVDKAGHLPLPRQVRVTGKPHPRAVEPAYALPGASENEDYLGLVRDNMSPRRAREYLFHEMGHLYDFRRMPESARKRFGQIMGDGRAWTGGPNEPREQFAEAYRAFALGDTRGGYGFNPSRKQRRQLRKYFVNLRNGRFS